MSAQEPVFSATEAPLVQEYPPYKFDSDPTTSGAAAQANKAKSPLSPGVTKAFLSRPYKPVVIYILVYNGGRTPAA